MRILNLVYSNESSVVDAYFTILKSNSDIIAARPGVAAAERLVFTTPNKFWYFVGLSVCLFACPSVRTNEIQFI